MDEGERRASVYSVQAVREPRLMGRQNRRESVAGISSPAQQGTPCQGPTAEAATLSVLFVIGDLDVGGTERHLSELAAALARQGVHTVVYTLTHEGRLAPALERAGVQILAPPAPHWLRRLPSAIGRTVLLCLTALTLWREMWSLRPDIVHFFLPVAYLIGGLVSLAAPAQIRVMSRRSLNDYQRRHPFAARLELWLHRRMTVILGNSRAVVEQLRAEGVPAEKLRLIYNGIDLSPFAARPARERVRGGLGLRPDALVLITVANLIPYKGHADLLCALANARNDLGPEWRLLCVGRDTGIGDTLKAQAEVLGISDRVLWLGEREDVPALLGAADIGILCSHQEGFSNSVLEGMAAGLPMIVTEVGGNAEAVVDGQTGLVVPAHDPDGLGRAICALAADPGRRAAFGFAGRRRVETLFSLDRCVAAYEEMYQGLTGGAGLGDTGLSEKAGSGAEADSPQRRFSGR